MDGPGRSASRSSHRRGRRRISALPLSGDAEASTPEIVVDPSYHLRSRASRFARLLFHVDGIGVERSPRNARLGTAGRQVFRNGKDPPRESRPCGSPMSLFPLPTVREIFGKPCRILARSAACPPRRQRRIPASNASTSPYDDRRSAGSAPSSPDQRHTSSWAPRQPISATRRSRRAPAPIRRSFSTRPASRRRPRRC